MYSSFAQNENDELKVRDNSIINKQHYFNFRSSTLELPGEKGNKKSPSSRRLT